ncbi:hypothetical protein O6H91_02G098400 [Diphasiastrum complanatum]|uniref:Uncharacterized protein n=1 Tax=Diphasiastrum complanatum TaxID=34168 RepID=A0ACC2EIM1_DIPCM|nr:hypothetical protein O6H91_02G098400 [Diphasiastrum complanatum]
MALAGRDRSILDLFSLDKLWDVFERLGSGNHNAQDIVAFGNTRVDWTETPDAHVFKADLPGVKEDEIKVQVEDGRILVISGERKKEDVEKNGKWHRVERYQGNFLRRFVLPDNAQPEGVKAKAEDGVLTITVPKAKIPEPNVRTISISKL